MRTLKNNTPAAALVLLLALTVAPYSKAAPTAPVLAQAPVVPLPVPEGTTLRIDGSSALSSINQALSDRFKAQFSKTQVDVGSSGSEAALQALQEGKVDLAAIGRPLTAEEQAQGLVAVAVARHKIAVFVGPNNPFANSLTGEQFASMFRGEITDWSQVGGQATAIRFVDRPDASDTRRALVPYPVFQAAPFQPGANTLQAAEDSTDAVIQQLGSDGISYAIADQVVNNPAVRVLPLYGTVPTDPRYPFSQPLSYVYKGTPSPAVQGFLGVAAAPEAQSVIESARVAAASVSSPTAAPVPPAVPASPAASPSAPLAASPEVSPNAQVAPADVDDPEELWSRWWWLLPILGALGVLAWMFRGRSDESEVDPISAVPEESHQTAAPLAAHSAADSENLGVASAAMAESQNSRIVLTSRNCKEAYAYWEVPAEQRAELKEQGGATLMLRLYDVTDIDAYYQAPHSIHEFACSEEAQDLHVPIPLDDRDYAAELGYVTSSQHWLPLVRSQHVRVPACSPGESGLDSRSLSNSLVSGNGAPGIASTNRLTHDRISSQVTLTPRDSDTADVSWDVSAAEKAALRQQGGDRFALRLYDAAEAELADPSATSSFRQYDCEESAQDLTVPIPLDDRDYVAEVGYVTFSGRWLSLAKSAAIHVPAGRVEPSDSNWIEATTKAASSSATQAVRPASENRLLLVPRSAEEVYAYWEVSEAQKDVLRQQGGQRLVLRVYDITGVDLNKQPPKGVQQFDCDETTNDRHVSVPSYGDYIATLGYLTSEGRWLSVARSAPVRIRAADVSTGWQPKRDRS